MTNHKRTKGFTLLEMLLVLVIVASLIGMFLNFTTKQFHQQQRDKTVLQMQQILNAALAYYVNYGSWPGSSANKSCSAGPGDVLNSTHPLLVNNYLPTATWTNAYAKSFLTCVDTSATGTNTFYVINQVVSANTVADAKIIAGTLPFGLAITASGGGGGGSVPLPTYPFSSASACTTGGGGGGSSTCMVVAGVNPPGQSLNTARGVNFGALYSSGQCVPYLACPAGMTPQIYAVPTSVSGNYDNASTNVYPISSYTAYATISGTPNATPPTCSTGVNDNCSVSAAQGGASGTGAYWRVCLSVTTQKGTTTVPSGMTNQNKQDTYGMGTIMVITRCRPGTPTGVVPNIEPTGSVFRAYN